MKYALAFIVFGEARANVLVRSAISFERAQHADKD